MTGNFKTFGDLSTTASANTSIDSANVDENSPMAGLNNAIRALGAMGKGALTFAITSGTDTYTATLAPVPDALATNFQYLVGFANPNTSPTPNINFGFGPKTIVLCDGVTPLAQGSLNGCHILEYDGTNMRLINPRLVDVTNGGLTVGAGIALNVSDLSAATPTQASTLPFEAGSGTKKATLAGATNSLVNIAASTKTQMQTATDGTTIVTPSQVQNHPGTAKAWVIFTGAAGAIVGSYNVASVTRNSAGNYTVTFTTAFANTNYAVVAANGGTSTGSCLVSSRATGSCVVQSFTTDGTNTNFDINAIALTCFGAQ